MITFICLSFYSFYLVKNVSIISTEHIKQYENIHKEKEFGVTGLEFAPHVQLCIAELKPKVILDYGCGQSQLFKALVFPSENYYRYDPAIFEISQVPVKKADLLINTDVLEHIPDEDLDEVLQHMASISRNAFFNIATRLAREVLPNGENAHCTIKTANEWLLVLRRHFKDVQLVVDKENYSCMFVTWNTSLYNVFPIVDDHKGLKKKVGKYERPLLVRVLREFGRFKRRVLKIKR